MSKSNIDICQWAADGAGGKLRDSVKANPDIVHKKDQSSRTSLHWAAAGGHDDIVQFLLSNGAIVSL